MTALSRIPALGLAALVAVGPATGQVLDQGTLEIRHAGLVAGSERFVLRQGQSRDRGGASLTASARYPADHAAFRIEASVQLTTSGTLGLLQMDVEEGAAPPVRILGAVAGNRLTLRTLARGSEAARQVPAGAGIVALDDSLLALYAAFLPLATPEGSGATAVFPRSGRRAAVVATRRNGAIEITGDLRATLHLDGEGRIRAIDVGGGMRAVRRDE